MAKRDSSEQVRRFGPMSGLLIAAAIAFIVLPSTLTLPNPSPTSQEEIAPVPPTDSKINPPVSNFTNLNSGNTGQGLGDGGGGGNEPNTQLPPIIPPGVGAIPPSTYQCVAGKQTEDRLSPDCVPFFIGENGGATYQGVTDKEVRIVIYQDPNSTLNTSQGTSTPPYNTIVDVDDPPKDREHPAIRTARGWQKFFFARYAAYKRKIHIYVQFGTLDSSGTNSAGTQAQDAAKAYREVKPFAIVNYAGFGNGVFYNNYMAEHGVLIFGSVAGRSASFYKKYPGQQWGYPPPLEYGAAQYAQFVCNSLVGKPTADVGGPALQNNQPRKFGLLYTTDKAFPGITDQALISESLIKKQCGLTIDPAARQKYVKNSFSVDNEAGSTSEGTNIALAFQRENVTTILWPAGYEAKISKALDDIKYYPEIILGDDDQQASRNGASFQNKAAWDHAWIVTSQTYDPLQADRICFKAYRSVDQEAPASDVGAFACDTYNDLRQLATGVQVAGPTLTPATIDQGYHAISIVESTDPQLPTCYYLPGDYTCVKDSAIMHYDPTGQPTSTSTGQPGCWRMFSNGKRFLPGRFPKLNLNQMNNDQHVCNNFSIAANLSLGP